MLMVLGVVDGGGVSGYGVYGITNSYNLENAAVGGVGVLVTVM